MALIRGLFALTRLAVNIHDAAQSRWETEAAMDEANRSLAAGPSAIERELYAGCHPPRGGLLLLADNDWAQCEIDNVLVDAHAPKAPPAAPSQPYRAGAELGALHGCVHVCPGRHIVVTKLPALRRAATLALVLYPGELFARRLDRASGSWVPFEASAEAKLGDIVAEGRLPLFNYFDAVAKLRVRAAVAQLPHEVGGQVFTIVHRILRQIEAGAPPAAMIPDVQKATALMNGVPLVFGVGMVKELGSAAWQRSAAGDFDKAWLIVQLGLMLLPEDATLLALLGELLLDQGRKEEAAGHLERAIAREYGLDETWRERAHAARARASA